MILGRPFLATAKVLNIDACMGKLKLRENDEAVTFDIGKSTKHPQNHHHMQYWVDIVDFVISFYVRESTITVALETQIIAEPILEPIQGKENRIADNINQEEKNET